MLLLVPLAVGMNNETRWKPVVNLRILAFADRTSRRTNHQCYRHAGLFWI